MTRSSTREFSQVLSNQSFRSLWIAQALAQTAQQAIHFVQMVLVEELTGSSTHIGLVILSFSLPGVLFSSIAGVVVDRWPKKRILLASNALRVILVSGYLLVLALLQGWSLLLGIYSITFLAAAVSQFFSPAEAAAIPLLVGEENLLAANSLFNLTTAISQVAGLIVLGPLATKLIGTSGAFVLIALMYLGATVAVSRMPKKAMPEEQVPQARLDVRGTLAEMREGWSFVISRKRVLLAMGHLTLVASVILILAMLAPGFASRVLGKEPEDAVFVFAPAGVGMVLSTVLLGRFGYRMRKEYASNVGIALVALGFIGLGLLTQGYRILPEPLLRLYPQAALSLTTSVMGISLLLGLTMSGVSILAQTMLQEESPHHVRGRVFALHYMLNNLIGIPPMLALGGVADLVGIPQVFLAVGVLVMIASVVSIYFTLGRRRRREIGSEISEIAGRVLSLLRRGASLVQVALLAVGRQLRRLPAAVEKLKQTLSRARGRAGNMGDSEQSEEDNADAKN